MGTDLWPTWALTEGSETSATAAAVAHPDLPDLNSAQLMAAQIATNAAVGRRRPCKDRVEPAVCIGQVVHGAYVELDIPRAAAEPTCALVRVRNTRASRNTPSELTIAAI